MYSSKHFEEAAFEIYLAGMRDYEQICERLLLERYDELYDIQEVLDKAQWIFENKVGMK